MKTRTSHSITRWLALTVATLLVSGCTEVSAPSEEATDALVNVMNKMWNTYHPEAGGRPESVEQVARIVVERYGVETFTCPPDGRSILVNPSMAVWDRMPNGDAIMVGCKLHDEGETPWLIFRSDSGPVMVATLEWADRAISPSEW